VILNRLAINNNNLYQIKISIVNILVIKSIFFYLDLFATILDDNAANRGMACRKVINV
jgi:hypothetical protein